MNGTSGKNSIVYSFRGRAFAAETTLELSGRELLAVQAGRDLRIPCRDIEAVRLWFAPRGANMTGYSGRIYVRGGKTITFSDRSWKSLIEIEYPRKEYRAFALELCARAEAANPQVRLQAGRNAAVMAATRLVAAGTTTLLAYLGIRSALGGGLLMATVLLAFAALFGYWSWQYVMRNAPRAFSARAVPEAVLPPG